MIKIYYFVFEFVVLVSVCILPRFIQESVQISLFLVSDDWVVILDGFIIFLAVNNNWLNSVHARNNIIARTTIIEVTLVK